MSCYENVIQINPNYANAHNNLGYLFNELGENQKAMSCYEKAIKINPKYIEAYNNLGNILKNWENIKKQIIIIKSY